jgi:tetratricopeptide (TPR) repeat protein
VAGERADAARIAAACGNLPLALRIAGTRLALRPSLPLAVLADRLEDEGRRLDELAVSDLQVRASLTLSYDALSSRTRAAFRRLGNIDTVDIPEWRIVSLLGSQAADDAVDDLVESGLLEPTGVDETGEPRYQMHSLICVFAKERARAEDERSTRVADGQMIIDAMLGIADVAVRRLPWTVPLPRLGDVPRPQPLPAGLVDRLTANAEAWFAAERTNLLAGLPKVCMWGWAAEGAMVMDRLAVYLWAHGQYADMRLGYQCLADCADRRVAARAKAALALLRHARGQYEGAAEEYQACAAELEELGEDEALGWVHHNLAACLIALGSHGAAMALVTKARARFAEDDTFAIGAVLHTQAAALSRLGQIAEAARIEAEALELARSVGEPRQLAMALHDRAWGFVLANGDLDRARVLTEEAIDLLRSQGSRSALAKALRTLGAVRAGLGERVLAIRAFQEARDIARELSERPRELSCTRAIAAGWIGEGRAAEAVPVLRDCLRTYREMGGTSATVITLHLLAEAYEASGDRRAAKEARAEAERLGDPRDSNSSTLLKLLLNLAAPA